MTSAWLRGGTLAAFLGGLMAFGCSNGGDPPGAGVAVEMTVSEGCERAHECRAEYPEAEAGIPFDLLFARDPTACVEAAYQRAGTPAQIDASVAAGRVRYDAEDFAACEASQRGETCDEFFAGVLGGLPTPAACATGLVGTVTPGGTCTIVPDCVEGDCVDGVCVTE